MISQIIFIIYILTAALCYALFMRHDVHLFQQNSYRTERYLRWWRGGNILSHGRWVMILVALLSLNIWSSLVAIALMLYLSIAKIRARHKSPLKITTRVWRLFITDACVTIGVVLSLYFMLGTEYLPALIGVVTLLSNAVMLLSNVIVTPLEFCITRWYYNDAKRIIDSHRDLIIIGITGSYGKTSTKNYLYRILSERYNVLVTPGNYNTLLGVVRTIRENLRPQHQIFIVEMGAKQIGDIKEICDLVHPSIGIITAVGEAHLETFKSFENIQRTKFELIDSLPEGGLGVLNMDSNGVKGYVNKSSAKCRIVTYSVDNQDVDFRSTDVRYDRSGLSFELALDSCDTKSCFRSHLLGGGNILNLTASAVVASHLDLPTKRIEIAISQIKSVEHRLSMRKSGGLTILDDAYNSNPEGAKMALAVLKDFECGEGNRRIVITPGFVEMGESQYAANRALGEMMASSCDYAVVVNKLNRDAICSGLSGAGYPTERIYIADTLNDAHQHLAKIFKVGDIVLYENDLPDSFK